MADRDRNENPVRRLDSQKENHTSEANADKI